jgi:hypothetical protein
MRLIQRKITDLEESKKPKLRLSKRPKNKKAKLIKQKKVGRWCVKIAGRLPYPIECKTKASIDKYCARCDRKIDYLPWRNGEYLEIAENIEKGVDYEKA